MIERTRDQTSAQGSAVGDTSHLKWDAATYEAVSRHFQVRNAQEVLSRFPFKGHENVLDIGSGDGLVTATLLAPRVPLGRIVGLDSSPAMLAHAREKYPPSRFPTVAFLEGDACDLDGALKAVPGTPHSFDLIFSNATLHWLIENQTQSDPKHLAALRGMNDHLSPEGEVLLAFVGQGALQELVDASLEITKLPQWSPHFIGFRFPELYSAARYFELMEAAGLRPIHVEIVDRNMRLSSAAELARWYQVSMRSFMGRLGELGVPAQLEFATQAVQRYVGTNNSGGEVSVTYRDLVARGTKAA